MDSFLVKLENYINIDLSKYYLQKFIKINDQINVSYKNNQIILEGGDYLDIIKNDIKILDSITNIINSKFNNITLVLKNKVYTYFDIIPEDIYMVLIDYIIENGEMYEKFIKITDVSHTFNKILSSELENRRLLYYITPYYSHLKELPDNVNSWEELFMISYKNRYPPKGGDITMYIKGKKVFRPIENIHIRYYDNNYTVIKNVVNDNDSLPISFELWFKDSYNFNRESLYWNFIKFV